MNPVDWSAYVRSHLSPLDIPAERELEIVEELAQQLESAYESARADGLDDADARARAAGEVPDWPALAARLREVERRHAPRTADAPAPAPDASLLTRVAGGLGGDVSYSVRTLARAPGLTLGAVTTLALGIGLAVALFSVVRGVLLSPLPYADPDRLVVLTATGPGFEGAGIELAYDDVADIRTSVDAFGGVASMLGYAATATEGQGAERILGWEVSPELVDVLGVPPARGRGFLAEDAEPGRGAVVLLGHGYWQRRFGGDPAVVGTRMLLDGTPHEIVGVMPPGFRIEYPASGFDVLVPLPRDHDLARSRAIYTFRVVARLAPGRTLSEANAALAAIGPRLEAAYPETNAGRAFSAIPLHDQVVGDARAPLLLLTAGVGLLLVLVVVNLAHLLVARGLARQRELAVRLALGGSVWRLMRQSIVDALLLAAAGAAAGVALAYGLVAALLATPSIGLPRLDQVALDRPAVIVAAVLCGVTAVAASLLPAGLVRRGSALGALRTGHETAGRAAGRTRAGLVVAQTALAFVLLAASSLLAASVVNLLRVDVGFDLARTASMRVSVPAARYEDRGRTVRFYTRLLDELASRPGVMGAGLVSSLPLTGSNTGSTLTIAGAQDVPMAERPTIGWQWVTPEYFETMGMPLVRGRAFSRADLSRDAHVTIVNESFARRHFGDRDPIGARVAFGPGSDAGYDWHEIVGVVGDVRHLGPHVAPEPRAYDLFGQHWSRTVYLVVRSSEDPRLAAGLVRETLGALDPALPVFSVRTLDDLASASVAPRRFLLLLVGAFAALGLASALAGLYATISHGVARRTREIGVRLALGASRGRVMRGVLGDALRLVVVGLALGLAAAAALRSVIASQLFGISPAEPAALAAVALVVTAAALAATWAPARRAMKIDPATALRYE